MITSNHQNTVWSRLPRWREVLVIAGLVLGGVEISQARASCGDYLHNGPTTTDPTGAKPLDTPAQSPCSHGRCDRAPAPMPVPAAPAPNPVSDDVTVVAWPLTSHLPGDSTRLDRVTQERIRPGHFSRIDRPPRG